MRSLNLTLALLLLIGINPAVAQAPETHTWLTAGGGVAAPVQDGADVAAALSLALSHQRGRHVFSLRTAAAFEVLWGDDYFDVGLLYGRALSSGFVFASLGAGLGAVFGTRGGTGWWGGDAESVGPSIGIPLEAQLFVRPLRFLGVGAYGFANINQERRLLAATLAVQLGALR